MRLVMDSRLPRSLKPDADKNIAVQLLRLVAPRTWPRIGGTPPRWRAGLRRSEKGAVRAVLEFFAEARAKRAELENNLDHVNQVLKDGASKARERRPRFSIAPAKTAALLDASAWPSRIRNRTP